MNNPIVVSYFTENYRKYANRLKAGLDRYCVENDIVNIPSQGSWQRNCAYKAQFIEEMRRVHTNRPVIWIDADATIQRELKFFTEKLDKFNGVDICVRNSGSIPPHPWNRIMSGTVWFGPGVTTTNLVKRWKEHCIIDPRRWDQVSLAMAIEEGCPTDIAKEGYIDRGMYKVLSLPEPYCAVFDNRPTNADAPCIVHWQASREMKQLEGDEGDRP